MSVARAERLSVLGDDIGELRSILSRLRWRLGLERSLVFAARGAMLGGAVLIGVSLISWLFDLVEWRTPAAVVGFSVPLVAALLLAVVRWPAARQAALAADHRFALSERLGTALELAGGVPRGRFDALQVSDALAATRALPRVWLTGRERALREGLLATAIVVLGVLSLGLSVVPRPTLPSVDRPLSAADATATDALERAAVADPLESAAADSPIVRTPADERTDAELASRVQQEQAERAALDRLSGALSEVSAGQPAADAIQRGDFNAARDQLSSLGDEADQLSDAAKQQLSRALQQAANATSATDRQLADRERQASQALGRNSYNEQRQALKNLGDQVQRSGARSAPADQLARDQGRLQQQQQSAASTNPGQGGRGQTQSAGAGAAAAPGTSAPAGAADAGLAGDGDGSQPGGPGIGTGTNPDVLGDPQARLLDAAGQQVSVPQKLGAGRGVRPTDGSEDQTGNDPASAPRNVAELVQAQQTGQVTPEQNLVPADQRPVVRGYFR